MAGPGSRPALRGRDRECEALDRLVVAARAGHSRVLVLRGEAGIGKTALLDHLCAHAAGCRVVRAAGVGAELELPYAGLHQLLGPLLDHLPQLPDPQAEALGTAFGLRTGEAPDRFLVGLAVLTLLSEAAAERTLVCAVDDAQWLDQASAQALLFAARRLAAESVALVLAVRESADGEDRDEDRLTGLPAVELRGLAPDDAVAVLESALTGPLDPQVRDRIVAETRGNPLALLELPRGLTSEEMAGGFAFSAALTVPGRIEESFTRRLAPLPPDTRRLLLVAAAEPVGDPVLVFRAAARLGLDNDAAVTAAEAGLVEFGAQVRFGHPLMRSAVYGAAAPEERRSAHRALAEVTDPELDADRRAWHRARATVGLDEDVAAELERSAGRAYARGGTAGEAAFAERAAELTPEPARRAARTLAAAVAKHRAGAPGVALRLLALAQAGPLDPSGRARAELLRAEIAFDTTRGRDAPALLLRAAVRLEPFDAVLARETYRSAFAAALSAGRLAHGGGVAEAAAAVLAAEGLEPVPQAERLPHRLQLALAAVATEGYGAAGTLREAVRDACCAPVPDERALRRLWLGCLAARTLGDDASWDALTDRQLRLGRPVGALALLPQVLAERFALELLSGELAAAVSLAAELDAVRTATGAPLSLNREVWLAAWHGHAEEALALIETRRAEVIRRGEGQWLLATEHLSAMLFNGLGRYAEALAVVERSSDHPRDLGLAGWLLPELVEAAVRSGRPDRAAAPCERLEEMARGCATDWTLGVAASCRALLSTGDVADRLYRDAIDRLDRTRIRFALARAHLLYGEWLRRERRRADAREHLRRAHGMFLEMGADGFAERTRGELLATGDTIRPRTRETAAVLTAQERQIAHLAADGRTNPEIGVQLFLSARTVEWHLRKVFTKLGVTSRRALRDAL